jgi:hypothetical protein
MRKHNVYNVFKVLHIQTYNNSKTFFVAISKKNPHTADHCVYNYFVKINLKQLSLQLVNHYTAI